MDIEKHLNTDNWFNFHKFYNFISEKKDFNTFVEVGVWKGHSITYLASLLEKRDVNLYAVDLWDETYKDVSDSTAYEHKDLLFEVYKENVRRANLKNKITNIKSLSWDAADNFEDSSVDFVFIDADHSYDSVIKDINAWLPKVKKGGIISGHDYFDTCPVKQAVDELFPNVKKYETNCWYLEKN
jgi:predicted O-methyltransferase YrrM